MKTTKIVIIATIIIIALCGIAMADAYTKTAVVTAMEKIGEDLPLWVVTATDENGQEWDFFADEDEEFYHIGDLLNLTMMDMSGEHDEMDEVVDVEFINVLTPVQVVDFLTK